MKQCGFTKACMKLGFLKGSCRNTGKPCISLHPQTCEECKKLGNLCIQENGAEKVCKDLLWDGQKCQKEDTTKPCISLFPSRCADCERLGVRCIKNNGAEKQCEKFDFDFKKEKCPPVGPVCAQVEPTTCEQCKQLGADETINYINWIRSKTKSSIPTDAKEVLVC